MNQPSCFKLAKEENFCQVFMRKINQSKQRAVAEQQNLGQMEKGKEYHSSDHRGNVVSKNKIAVIQYC